MCLKAGDSLAIVGEKRSGGGKSIIFMRNLVNLIPRLYVPQKVFDKIKIDDININEFKLNSAGLRFKNIAIVSQKILRCLMIR